MDVMNHEIDSCGDNAEMEMVPVRDDLSEEGLDVNNVKSVVYYPQVADEFTPKVGQEFQTLDNAHTFYNTYAMQAGFSVRKHTEKKKEGSGEICRKSYVCYKQGKGKLFADVDARRKRGSIKEDCSARMIVVKRNDVYVVTIIDEGLGYEKIKQIIRKNDSERNKEMECGGISASKSVNMTSTYELTHENSYIEPNHVRAKGCGKRLKGGKERALGKAKKVTSRRCHACGLVGVTHDKRNCPMLNNLTGESNDDATQEPSVANDYSDPTEISKL